MSQASAGRLAQSSHQAIAGTTSRQTPDIFDEMPSEIFDYQKMFILQFADDDGLVQSLDFEDDVELNKMVDDGDLT